MQNAAKIANAHGQQLGHIFLGASCELYAITKATLKSGNEWVAHTRRALHHIQDIPESSLSRASAGDMNESIRAHPRGYGEIARARNALAVRNKKSGPTGTRTESR